VHGAGVARRFAICRGSVAAARLNGLVHGAGNLPLGDDPLPAGDGLLPLRDGLLPLRDDLRNRLGVPTVIREIAARNRDDLAHVARLCSDLSAAMLRRWTGLGPLPVANGDPLSRRGAAP
jgi:hypothetical protein